MLSIGKIGGGNGDPSYYLDAVASGHEDYYVGVTCWIRRREI